VSTPPKTAVDDLRFDSAVEQQLSWTYYRCGDYDQNGEVNISDVTVIGQNFGRTAADPDWARARVADGDGNGEVNISDLTPIGNNFGSPVGSFAVHTGPAAAGSFTAVSGATVEFSSAPVPPGGGPREFSHLLAAPVVGNWYVVYALAAGEAAETHSNVVQYDPANLPPMVALKGIPAGTILPGTEVTLMAESAADPDGTIEKYEWDPYGTGEFINTLADDSYTHAYSRIGEFTPRLRVTDDGGASLTVSGDPVDVSPGQMQIDVVDGDSEVDAGYYLSAALGPTGLPSVTYTCGDPGEKMRFVRAEDQYANSWHSPFEFTYKAPYRFCSLTVSVNYSNHYVRCLSQVKGGTAHEYRDSDSPSGIGDNFSGENTYHTEDDLKYGFGMTSYPCPLHNCAAYTDNANGDSGSLWYTFWLPVNPGRNQIRVESAGTHCSLPSLFVRDEVPCIAYRRAGHGTFDLCYTHATSDAADVWTDPQVLVPGSELVWTSQRSLISLHDGNMLIAYWSESDQALRCVFSTFVGGWSDPVDIDTGVECYSNLWAARMGSIPCMAYADANSGELRLVYADDKYGKEWNTPIALASSSSGISYPAMVGVFGRPLVFFRDNADGNVKAAVFH
jgi:hypothetical protein